MKKLMSYSSLHTSLAALLLRLIFGSLFIYHGYSKIANYDQIKPMFGDIIGIGAEFSFHLVIFAEFVCGILVTLGFFTRITVIPIFITMFVAYFVAHAEDPFMNKELPLLFLILSIVIFILGSGRFSIDGLMFRKDRTARLD